MKTSTIVWIIVIILIIIGIVLIADHHDNYAATPSTSAAPMIPAGGETPATGTSTTSGTSGSSAVAPQGTVVLNTSVTSALGTYLVASNSMTLYQYSKDTVGVSNCTGGCASAWPPYTISSTTAMPLLGEPGVAGVISTITRADGTMQVTYNGMPLYLFASDSKVGDATGQNENGFTVVTP